MARDPRDYDDCAEYCPSCGANLQGPSIDADKQHLYGATHFSRKIGIYSMKEDRTIKWACPDCDFRWDRA